MEPYIRQNPLTSPLSQSSPTSIPGVSNLSSTPLSPPLVASPIPSPQFSHFQRNLTSPRPSETTQVTVYPSSVSLRVRINAKKNSFFFLHFLTYLKKIFFSY